MNKYRVIVFLAAGLLVSGCSKKDGNNNPVGPPVVEVTKKGAISQAESWSETGKIYRVTADCSIEAPVTWKKGIVVVVDPAAVIHIGNNGVLTIEENVTVKFRAGAYIEAGGNSPGTLVATGSATAPIVFKADTAAQWWGLNSGSRSGGIVVSDSATSVRLSHCTISGAAVGIYISAGFPVITNCTISSCKGDGIYFDTAAGPSDSATFTGNTISGCGGYPLTLPAGKLGNLSGVIAFSALQPEKSAIHVLGASVEDSAAVWRKKALPYRFSGTTIISSFRRISCVTIMPGVVCEFEAGAYVTIGDPRFGSGTLIARGAPTDSIFFTNSLPGIAWGDSLGGILVGLESPVNTVLEYCVIQNALSGVYVNTSVTIQNCLFKDNKNYGIVFDKNDNVSLISGNSFLRNGADSVYFVP